MFKHLLETFEAFVAGNLFQCHDFNWWEKKKQNTEKVKFENKTILVLEFLRTEELNTTCSIFA